MTRSCDGCTKCCEGYLTGEIHGHKMYPGRPCHFKCKTGCEIYEQRPERPCKSYVCEWLVDPNIPGWFKPNEINAIVTKRKLTNGMEFWDVAEAGEKLKVEVLNWLLHRSLIYGTNIVYHIDGGKNVLGSPEFQSSFWGVENELQD